MSLYWITKIQEKLHILYSNCDKKKLPYRWPGLNNIVTKAEIPSSLGSRQI